MEKDFEQKLKTQINKLEGRPEYGSDETLRQIVEIFKQVKTPEELAQQSRLITHITIDSLVSQDSGNIILEFLKAYKK
jgi:hypothetical protein